MLTYWKVIIAVLLLTTIAIDGSRARRRRRNVGLDGEQKVAGKSLHRQGQVPSQQNEQDGQISGKQAGRQYNPYQGSGLGAYNYGYGNYGQYGQGGNLYGSYYNQYPGNSYGGYGGGGGGSYGGNNGYGGYGNYYWNAGEKQKTNMFAVCLSSLLTVAIYWFTI